MFRRWSRLQGLLPGIVLVWITLGAMPAAGAVSAASGAQRLSTPPGGTVRSLAVDPFHAGRVLLGTNRGVLFASRDGGRHWHFLSRIAHHDTWVVSSLIADPSAPGHWYAALWSWASRTGGVFVSHDDGGSWQALFTGHAVRALAQAASDSRTLVAGTLDGVYRSRDAGRHWSLISPRGDRELQNIESVAIDPHHPQEIYVGTWHLPWKTVNGGHDWWQMRQGVIDDSDVFSIAVDRTQPSTIYLSACSGIYRSEDKGNSFRKIQGIPYSARRTPALVQDPGDPATIYAGTTQGLWVTHNGGDEWARITRPRYSINAVLLLPATRGSGPRILLGTNFAGVYASSDGGGSFKPANAGFSSRHVSSVAEAPDGRYLAVTGDQDWGGVFFHSRAAGGWRQLPPPDHQHDVFSLHWSPAGLLAATADGVFRLPAFHEPAAIRRRPRPAPAGGWRQPRTAPHARVYQFASTKPEGEVVFAAAQSGLYRSGNGGASWSWLRAAPAPLYRVLALPPRDGKSWLFIAGEGYVLRSPDQGRHFIAGRLSLPGGVNQLAAVERDGGADLIFAATTRGLYRSQNWGASWELCGHGLPAAGMQAVHVQSDGIYVLASAVGQTYRSRDQGAHWQPVALPPQSEAVARSGAGLLARWSPAGSSPTPSASAPLAMLPSAPGAHRQPAR